MRNILRSDLADVWNGTDPVNENKSGGVALWDIPPAVHNACNPAMFVRTQYLHMTGTYEPNFSVKPNYLSINNTDVSIVFDYPTKSPLRLALLTDKGALQVLVYSGVSVWRMSDKATRIVGVTAIGISADGTMSSDFVKDGSFIYILPDKTYEDGDYICAGNGKILYRNTEVQSNTFRITGPAGESVRLTAESYKGIIKYDVSEAVRLWMSDSLAEFEGGSALILDGALGCGYRTTDIGDETLSFLALNAVAQIGESSDRSGDGGRVLTRFRRLRLYDGYQLDYSVLAASEDVTTSRGTAKAGGVWRVLVGEGSVNLQNESGADIQDDASRDILIAEEMDARILWCCIPDRPFYVRWINRLGGVDYFMFGWQQKITPSVKSVSVFEPFVENPRTAPSNVRPYAVSSEHSVTVGADGLSASDYGAISALPFSPLIEWWSEDLSRWVRLSVSKFDGSHYSRPETRSVEITFTLPAINTQY